MREYIVYACPVGPLSEQLDRYYEESKAACGPNTAHRYMPHVTLTGFFHDTPESVPVYVEALAAALERARPTQAEPVLTISDMLVREDFIALTLEGDWLKALIADFAHMVDSPSRADALRLKDWLHLSLAYGYPPEQYENLADLARKLVDPRALVAWELRFYERHEGDVWTCHASWEL